MVSLAQGNTLRKSAFLLRILVKDYVHAGWVIDYFLRKQFLKKISSKISSEATKNSQRSVPSVCSVDKFFRNILMFYTEKMCTFVRNKGNDDLRVTQKTL